MNLTDNGTRARRQKMHDAAANSDKHQGRNRLFDALAVAHGLPEPVHQFVFCEGRKWRADYCWEGWLLVEQVGGVWTHGHHSRGQSQIDDMEKFNHAVLLGYSVLQFTPQQFDSGDAFVFIKRVLKSEADHS